MQKIHLLFVITKLELGGAQKQLLNLLTHLDRQRYILSLITAREGLLVREVQSIENLRLIKSNTLERPINPIKDLLALWQIFNFIKQNEVDIVHTHSSKAGILGRWAGVLAGVKIILHTVHGWSFHKYQNLLFRKFIIWLERFTALFTTQLIVVSNHDLEKGLRNRIGRRDKYKLIRYGINYKDFTKKQEGLREELGLGSSDLLIGMVACFKPQKSPQDFIKLAFFIIKSSSLINVRSSRDKNLSSSLKKVRFILIGDGILRKKIERMIVKLGLTQEIILMGWRRDIPRILSAIDIFVLTSLWEGLPISVLEAMCASLPIVVSNTGGVSELILDGKNGFLVPPRDIRKMAEKINNLLEDEDLRRMIGSNSRAALDYNFSLDTMIRNTDNLYKDLVKKKI